MTGRSCSTCEFADPGVGDEGELLVHCRRFPPQLFVLDGETTQAWPQPHHGDWCGEYRAVPS